MSNFVIIPDSSSDLPKALRERFGVPAYMRGVVYHPDGSSEIASTDKTEEELKAFYESMTDKKHLFTTATPTIGNILETFEAQLKEGKDILAITLSSGLSGTYRVSVQAKDMLLEQYPDRKIICVDSLRFSSGVALLTALAYEKQQSGATLEETADYLNAIKHRLHQIGPMDDLFFLVRTGRISNFKAFFGSLVGINPMADFNRKGLSQVLGKFKGKKNAFDAVISYMEATIENPEDQIIFVGHSNRRQAAEVLAQRIQDTFHPKEIIINPIGMACGASIGPGMCAAYYLGKEISEDLKEEQIIMNDIIARQKAKK